MIPAGFIQDLLARVDLVDLVGRYVQLRRGGANYLGLCPFHGEKSPSFTVSPSKQFYHCFGCGVHGNAIGFLMEHTGASFPEAVRDLAQQCGLQVPEDARSPLEREHERVQRDRAAALTEVLARAGEHFRRQLRQSERAIAYLKSRGLTGEIAARFGLGYAPEGWHGLAGVFPHYDDPQLAESGLVIVQGENGEEQKRYDRFRDRIMFPIRSVQGDIIGFGGRVLDRGEPKYLNSPETPVFVKGRELYGLYEARAAIRDAGYALVVEGYMDVVALAQLGFPHAVATLGTACTEDHVQKLFRFTDKVVFSFDGDAAGQRAAARALEASLPHARDTRRIGFLFLPAEHDPDSYVREQGPQAFERCVQEAVPLSRQLIALASADGDLELPEGRATFLRLARQFLARLPEGALRPQIAGEVAAIAKLPAEDVLRGLQPAHPSEAANERSEIAPGADTSRLRNGHRWRRRDWGGATRQPLAMAAGLLDRAAWMLVQHAELWETLSDEAREHLVSQAAPYGPFFAWLDRHVHDQGCGTPSSLLQALQEAVTADAGLAGVGAEALLRRIQGLLPMASDASAIEMQRILIQMKLEALDEEVKLLVDCSEHSAQMQARLRELITLRPVLRRQLDELKPSLGVA